MALVNFDPPAQERRRKRHHWMLPESHFLVVGPTGSGKTNLLLNMVMRWLDCSGLTVYTASRGQEKYKVLSDFYDSLGAEGLFSIREPDEVTPVSALEEEGPPQTVVFDDIRLDAKSLAPVKEYFAAGRHKNVTAVYLAQSYYDTPKYIRRNAGCVVLMRGLDQRDIREIASDHADGVTKDQLAAAYREATAEKYGYFVIDRTAEEVPVRYRRRFDGVLVAPAPSGGV